MFQISLEDNGVVERLGAANVTLEEESKTWLTDMANWVVKDLQQRVPMKTGALKQSIRTVVDKNEATFFALDYGAMLDAGAGPFTISARGGKPMAFTRGGEKVFAWTVKHPGYAARNFTIESLDAAELEADRLADEIATRIWSVI